MSYFTYTVKIEKEDVKSYLVSHAGYSEDDLKEKSESELLEDGRMLIDDALGNFISDYVVYDKETIVVGDFD